MAWSPDPAPGWQARTWRNAWLSLHRPGDRPSRGEEGRASQESGPGWQRLTSSEAWTQTRARSGEHRWTAVVGWRPGPSAHSSVGAAAGTHMVSSDLNLVPPRGVGSAVGGCHPTTPCSSFCDRGQRGHQHGHIGPQRVENGRGSAPQTKAVKERRRKKPSWAIGSGRAFLEQLSDFPPRRWVPAKPAEDLPLPTKATARPTWTPLLELREQGKNRAETRKSPKDFLRFWL